MKTYFHSTEHCAKSSA